MACRCSIAQSSAAIGAIAIAPNDPNDVWVGTGESNPRNDVESGDGIYHSTDGGKTWTHAGLADAGLDFAASRSIRATRARSSSASSETFSLTARCAAST